MVTMTTRRVVIGDDHVGAQTSNVKHHAPEQLFFTPGAKCLFGGLGKTEVSKTEKMRFRTLHFGGGNRFTRANHTELFVKFRPDGILSAFAESGKQRHCVDAVL